MSRRRVRAPDSRGRAAGEVERVRGAEDECPRGHVGRVIGRAIAEVGDREEAGHVGVVHQDVPAEPIGLVCVDAPEVGVLHDGMSLDSRADLLGQLFGVPRQPHVSELFLGESAT